MAAQIFNGTPTANASVATAFNAGVELITNGGTAWTGATGATPPTGWSAVTDGAGGQTFSNAGSVLTITAGASVRQGVSQGFATTVGVVYKYEVTLKNVDAAAVELRLGVAAFPAANNSSILLKYGSTADFKYEGIFTATATTTYIALLGNASAANNTTVFTSASVKQVAEAISGDKYISGLSFGAPLLSKTRVSLAADADTALYTVPAGKRCVLSHAVLIVGADAGTTTLSIGQNSAETDFIGAQTLSGLDSADDAAILMPVPNATPVLIKSYVAGTVIEAKVESYAGGDTNTLFLFGFLY